MSRIICLPVSASPFRFCLLLPVPRHSVKTKPASPWTLLISSSSFPSFQPWTTTISSGIPIRFGVLALHSHSQMESHSSAEMVAHKLLQSARHIIMLSEFRPNWIKPVKILLLWKLHCVVFPRDWQGRRRIPQVAQTLTGAILQCLKRVELCLVTEGDKAKQGVTPPRTSGEGDTETTLSFL